jgi:hypothetical protein
MYQITKICLDDYNIYHKDKYSLNDMYNPEKAYIVADWYVNKRIPQMLRYYRQELNLENQLVCYNAGISYIAFNKPLPVETVNYIRKYKRLSQRAK